MSSRVGDRKLLDCSVSGRDWPGRPYVMMHLVFASLHNTASSYFARAARIGFHLNSLWKIYLEGALISKMSIKSSKAKVPPSSNWMNLQKVRSKLFLVFLFLKP